MRVVIDGSPLGIDEVVAVASGAADVEAGADLDVRMRPARELVEDVIANDEVVYGITTGFGALANTRIPTSRAAELQVDLLRSHASGVGSLLGSDLVRAMLLCRARTLAQGHSGVRPDIVRFLIEMVNRGIVPAVPSQGSVGASGDLAPFAHLALPVIGEGWVLTADGRTEPAGDALARVGLEPLTLEPKEGLSLLNGTEGMLAHGCLAVHRAEHLANAADAACALTVEALMGSSRPFDERIHRLRPHPGQATSARRIASLLAGSEIDASHHDDFTHKVQDAYSLRCAPQVHGAVRDTISHARAVFEVELGSVVDNPIVFAEDGDVVSGGNFHGQPLAFATTSSRSRSPSSVRSRNDGRIACSIRTAPGASRPSSPTSRAWRAATCSRSTRQRRSSLRTASWHTRRAWSRSRPRACRRTTYRWDGARPASWTPSSRTRLGCSPSS